MRENLRLLKERLDQTTDPTDRKLLKAAIYALVEAELGLHGDSEASERRQAAYRSYQHPA